MGDVVLDALLARLHHERRPGGIGRRDEQLLRGHLGAGGDVDPRLREAQTHVDEEALVEVLVDERVLG